MKRSMRSILCLENLSSESAGLFERQIQYEELVSRENVGHWSYKIILDTIQGLRKRSQGGQTVNRKSMIDSFRSVKK